MSDSDYISIVEEAIQNPTAENLQKIIEFPRFTLEVPIDIKNNNRNGLVGYRRKTLDQFLKMYETYQLHEDTLKIIKQDVSELNSFLEIYQQYKIKLEDIPNVVVHNNYAYFKPINTETYFGMLEGHFLLNTFKNLLGTKNEEEDDQHQLYFDESIMFYSAFKLNNTIYQNALFNYPPIEILSQFTQTELETLEMKNKRMDAIEKISASKDMSRYVVSTQIECKKCKKKTVLVEQKQTRSADEATSLIYTCSACGHKWKVD